MSPKQTGNKVGIVAALLATVVFVIVSNLLLPSRLAPTAGGYRTHYATLYPTTIEGLAASCSDISHFADLKPDNYAVLTKAQYEDKDLRLPQFQTVLPVTGYMAPDIPSKSLIKYYSQTQAQQQNFSEAEILRLQYAYDTTVIWYGPGTDPEDLASVRKLVAGNPNVMALPWEPSQHENSDLPDGSNIAWTSWGSSQACFAWNPAVLFTFRDFVKAHPAPRAAEAPIAKLNTNGKLPEIDSILLRVIKRAHQNGAPLPTSTPMPSPTLTTPPPSAQPLPNGTYAT